MLVFIILALLGWLWILLACWLDGYDRDVAVT